MTSLSRRVFVLAGGTALGGVAGCVTRLPGGSVDAEERLAIETGEERGVGATVASLSGELLGIGDTPEATVRFEYRSVETDDWTATESKRREAIGPVYTTVDELTADTTYEFRAVATADEHRTRGEKRRFRTARRIDLDVETGAIEWVDGDTALAAGELLDLDEIGDTIVSIRYRQTDTQAWERIEVGTQESPGTIEARIDGLVPGEEYEYQAVAESPTGRSGGAVRSYVHEPNADPRVDTSTRTLRESAGPDRFDVTFAGDLLDLGDLSSVAVGFEYRESGTDDWSTTETTVRETPGEIRESAHDLAAGTEYEFRAVAIAGDLVAHGQTRTVTPTSSGSSTSADGSSEDGSDEDESEERSNEEDDGTDDADHDEPIPDPVFWRVCFAAGTEPPLPPRYDGDVVEAIGCVDGVESNPDIRRQRTDGELGDVTVRFGEFVFDDEDDPSTATVTFEIAEGAPSRELHLAVFGFAGAFEDADPEDQRLFDTVSGRFDGGETGEFSVSVPQ